MSGRYLTDLSLLACGVNWLSLAQILEGWRNEENRLPGRRQQIDAGLRPSFQEG